MSFIVEFVLFGVLFATNPFQDHNRTAYYFGQNSGGTEQDLRTYCTGDVDILVLSFLTQFGIAELSLDMSHWWGETFPGTLLMHFPAMAEDIKYCQSQGKQIFLSLGGDLGNYDLTSDDQAIKLANDLHNIFGSGNSDTRPFDSVVLDGYDLDIEHRPNGHYSTFINEIRRLEPGVLTAAAPQCVYPDASLQPVLDEAFFDYVFVQFYNNPPCAPGGSDFNYHTWDDWATRTSKNKNVRVFFGTPGGEYAAGSGYQGFDALPQVVDALKRQFPDTFGGIMMWDASVAFSNTKGSQSYARLAKSLL